MTLASIYLRHRRNNERTTFLTYKKSISGGALSREEACAEWKQVIQESRSHESDDQEIVLEADEGLLGKYL